jgi:hypothetical protein
MRIAGWARLSLTICLAAASLGATAARVYAGTSGQASQSRVLRPGIAGVQSWTPFNSLNGLAVASPSSPWAVGSAVTGRTLVEHWDGRSWKQVASPSPGGRPGSVLSSVAAAGSAGAWAVGYFSTGAAVETLIERWNGRSWKQVASPSPGGSRGSSTLSGVAVTGPSNAWAVGSYERGHTYRTLIEHWNGRAWKQVASPSPGGVRGSFLAGVAADRSSSGAWAVGYYRGGTTYRTLIEHWNGRAWKQVASPSPGGADGSFLDAVALAGSGAWAVGDVGTATVDQTLIERWNGRVWRPAASPRPGGSRGSVLTAVTGAGASGAWAVGYYFTRTRVEPAVKTLTEHWNGRVWKQVASPSPGGSVGSSGDQSLLVAVSAASSSDVWAAGRYSTGNPSFNPLIERWTGRKWKHVTSADAGQDSR